MKSIFVECLIRAPIEVVWDLTQDPAMHERWDLRFSEIKHLPSEPDKPQRFCYTTRVGAGIKISGWGETVGEATKPDGTRTTALRFGSDSRLSLIREGSGYWQYVPVPEGTVFRTRYDYVVRYGWFGRLIDLIVRPVIGWATAWSFDSLRMWAEDGIRPEECRLRGGAAAIVRWTLAFVWIYHGLVPKILFPNSGEVSISAASGLSESLARAIHPYAGAAEIGFGLAIAFSGHFRRLLAFQTIGLMFVLLPIAVNGPEILTRPFQPLTTNLLMAALGVVGLLAGGAVPSARRCRRITA